MIVDLVNTTQYVNYWKQERLVVNFGGSGNGDKVLMWSSGKGSASNPMATYTPDSDGYCIIDVTDYLRAVLGISSVTMYFKEEPNATVWSMVVTLKGLIDPANVLIPYHIGKSNYAPIIPPLRMIEPLNNEYIYAELYQITSTQRWSLSGATFTDATKRVIKANTDFSLYLDGSVLRTYNLIKRICGREYASVRWESFTGVTREHTFEVTKPKTETQNAYSLMPVDNEYIDIKGRQDGFTLRLDNLSNYDLWYYADLINSSNVEVSFDASNNPHTFDRVQVTTKNITFPDGETKVNGKLEIAVNWKRYDAVAM